jgi:hypothetical protein
MDNEEMSSSGGQDSGVVIPEEFQKQVHAMVHKAPKEHLQHIRDRVNAREELLRQEEMQKQNQQQSKGKKTTGVKMNFSTEGSPIAAE